MISLLSHNLSKEKLAESYGHTFNREGSLYLDLLCIVFCHFPYGVLGQVWTLIVSIPDLCLHLYFVMKTMLFDF